MERNFYNEEFEHFLKQKSDQYKMYPSDRVWNNVYTSLHNTRRRLGLGLVLLLIVTTSLFVSREVLLTQYTRVAGKITQDISTPVLLPTTTNIEQNTPESINFSNKKDGKVTAAFQSTFTKGLTSKKSSNTSSQSVFSNTPFKEPIGLITAGADAEAESLVFENNTTPAIVTTGNSPATVTFHTEQIKFTRNIEKKISAGENVSHPPLIQNNYNGSIGLFTNHKWSLQLYASPIVSYRRLANLSRSDKYVPVAINYGGNIDNYVHHKPAVGFELGTKMQYKISNGLYLYAGAQLNYSRYYIDAYNYHSERATIALNSSTVADTVANFTNIRNFEGYAPEQLQNQYFQVSIPIGAELKLLGNKRLQLSIAGSLQPTYLINSTSYLISSDYKNYTQNPDLARRFNLHTNFEAFVSYKLGGLKWQLGPQFRYQVLSSYSDKYPIREYLTEFGIKLGVTKTIW